MVMELFRYSLIFLHLLLFAVAIVKVIEADLAVLKVEPMQHKFQQLGTHMLYLLLGLWITGLLVIFLDYGTDYQRIMENSKLMLKMLCVSVLSINGILIHAISLSILNQLNYLERRHARILCLSGAVSTSHWFMAAFVGSTKPLASLPMSMLLTMYLCIVFVSTCAGIIAAPIIQNKINQQRANLLMTKLGLRKKTLEPQYVGSSF